MKKLNRDENLVGMLARLCEFHNQEPSGAAEFPAVHPVPEHRQPGHHRDQRDRGERGGLQRRAGRRRVDDGQREQEQQAGGEEPLGLGQQACPVRRAVQQPRYQPGPPWP